MQIKSVVLRNFRNYSFEKFIFNPKVNVLVGDNAQGKTNLLEGIYFSCIGKSFKTKNERELIKKENTYSTINLDFEKQNGDNKIFIEFKNGEKYVKLNEINITKISSLLGNLCCVFFSPNELKLVKDAPEDRRKFMDIDISQLSKEYYLSLLKYNKILKERNKLLKSTDSTEIILETLPIWDYQLVKVASEIILDRLDFIKKLNLLSGKEHEFLTENAETLKLQYSSVEDFYEKTKDEIEEILLKKLKENYEKDLKLKYTTVGPHRDDIKIFLNDFDVKNFGSQGQQRTVLLSMKLAELEIFKDNFGEYPILLLDDVFSELDEKRKHNLFKRTQKVQTFITTTKFDIVEDDVNVITIENGKILIKKWLFSIKNARNKPKK